MEQHRKQVVIKSSTRVQAVSMNGNGNEALAQEMLAESGRLNIAARRKPWQAMGALEVREQDSTTLRTLAEPLKKRARLALACAKKVMPIWLKALCTCSRRADSAVTGYFGRIPLYDTGFLSLLFKKNGAE